MILRFAILWLLGLVLAVRVVVAQSDPEFRLNDRIAPALSAQGMELKSADRPGRFRHPACDTLSRFLVFNISLDAASLARYFDRESKLRGRVIYLDRTWEEQRKFTMLLMLVRQRLLFSLGLSPLYPTKQAILVLAEPSCPEALTVDLTRAWYVSQPLPRLPL